MALVEAPESITTPILWAVKLSMSIAERYVNDAAAMPISAKPISGTITMGNGWKREAQYLSGGRSVLQYRTPAGNWRNANPTEAATFVATSR